MNDIKELRKLHTLSKPELVTAMKNARRHVSTVKMEPMTGRTILHLALACESYSDVIDTLFAEIDRLSKEDPQ